MNFQLDTETIKSAGRTLQASEAIGSYSVTHAVNLLIAQCYGAANAAGWHNDLKTGERKKHNHGERLMLCVSELSEGMEGHRKNRMDDKLPHRWMLEVELADCLIRIFDYVGYLGLDLARHLKVQRAVYLAQEETLRIPCDSIPERLVRACLHLTNAYDAMPEAPLEEHSEACAEGIRVNIGSELARAVHHILDLAIFCDYDLGGAIAEKMEFNAVRPDHKKEARLADDGKKF